MQWNLLCWHHGKKIHTIENPQDLENLFGFFFLWTLRIDSVRVLGCWHDPTGIQVHIANIPRSVYRILSTTKQWQQLTKPQFQNAEIPSSFPEKWNDGPNPSNNTNPWRSAEWHCNLQSNDLFNELQNTQLTGIWIGAIGFEYYHTWFADVRTTQHGVSIFEEQHHNMFVLNSTFIKMHNVKMKKVKRQFALWVAKMKYQTLVHDQRNAINMVPSLHLELNGSRSGCPKKMVQCKQKTMLQFYRFMSCDSIVRDTLVCSGI